MSLAAFEPNPRSSIVAKATPTAHMFSNVVKTVLVIVYSTPLPIQGKTAFYLVCCWAEVWLSFGYLPYYREWANMLKCVCSGMLGVSGILTVVVANISSDHDIVFYVMIFAMALACIASWLMFKRRWRMVCPRHMQLSMKRAKEEDVENWAKAFFKNERICIYRDVIVRTNFVWFTEEPDLIFLAEQIYQAALELFPKCPHVMLSYGMFLKLVKNDLTSSSYYFKKAEGLNPPIHVQFVCSCSFLSQSV